MRTTVAAVAAMLAALSLTVTDARAEPPSASQATINGPVVQPRPAAPVATQEPTDGATEEVTEGESASTSPSPSPAARRPVDEEGEQWVNLAVIGSIALLGTVVAFLIAGGLLRRRSRRDE